MPELQLPHRSIHSVDVSFGIAGGLDGARNFLGSAGLLVVAGERGVTAERALGAAFADGFAAGDALRAVVLAGLFATDLTAALARGFGAGLLAVCGAGAASCFRMASRDSIIGFDWLATWVKTCSSFTCVSHE